MSTERRVSEWDGAMGLGSLEDESLFLFLANIYYFITEIHPPLFRTGNGTCKLAERTRCVSGFYVDKEIEK